MENVISFLKVNNGADADAGEGSSSGYGDGYGDGAGSGYGDGDGSSSGSSSGSGYGAGYGSGDSDGDGSGDSDGIKRINKDYIHNIDGIGTVLYFVRENVAKGAILNDDLSFAKCFIVKRNNLFAHGETIKKAMESLEAKMFNNLDIEERIAKFLEEFELNRKYPAMKFYDWHNRLTGSCEMGRKSFAHNHGIDLENDEFTVVEFIDITKNDYGSSVIRKVEEYICELSN